MAMVQQSRAYGFPSAPLSPWVRSPCSLVVGKAVACPTLPGIGLHGVVVGIDGGVVPLAEMVVGPILVSS